MEPKPEDTKLTPKEVETYDAIIALTQELGHAPELRQIGERLGITKAGVQRHTESLRRKGAITGPRVVGEWAPTRLGAKLRKKA